eukprot:s181_g22.t1
MDLMVLVVQMLSPVEPTPPTVEPTLEPTLEATARGAVSCCDPASCAKGSGDNSYNSYSGSAVLERGKSSVALMISPPTTGLPTVRYGVPKGATGPSPRVEVERPAPGDLAKAPASTVEAAPAAPHMEPPPTGEHAEALLPPTMVPNPPVANAPPTTVALHPDAPPDVDTQQLLDELRKRVGWNVNYV